MSLSITSFGLAAVLTSVAGKSFYYYSGGGYRIRYERHSHAAFYLSGAAKPAGGQPSKRFWYVAVQQRAAPSGHTF